MIRDNAKRRLTRVFYHNGGRAVQTVRIPDGAKKNTEESLKCDSCVIDSVLY